MNQYSFKKAAVFIFCLGLMLNTFSQSDNIALLRQAKAQELKFDESGALSTYKMIAANDTTNVDALVKCVEFYCSIGERQKDKIVKSLYFDSAETFAQQAFARDAKNSGANYSMSLVALRKTEVEDDNKKLVAYILQTKTYVDGSLAANSDNAKANYLLGKWHYELMHSGWIKKGPVKNSVGIPDTQLDTAAYYMEKSRTIDPYYAIDYLDLAKVYQYDNQPAKMLDVLNKLVKLPTRTFDDAAIKNEGRQMLSTIK